MHAVCHALRISPATLTECFSDPFWVLRLISYPPRCPESTDSVARPRPSLGCGPHRDYGWLTFVITDERPDSVGALEISRDGSDAGFEPAVLPPPGCFLLNFGDCLEALTNGLFPATLHRVAQPRTERLAIAAFIGNHFLEFQLRLVAPWPRPEGRSGRLLTSFLGCFVCVCFKRSQTFPGKLALYLLFSRWHRT